MTISENGGVNYAVRNYSSGMDMAAPAEKAMGENGLMEAETVVTKIEITATVNGVYQIIR